MILAIDAGNTRIKWGVHDGANWLAQGAAGYHEVALLEAALRAIPGIRQAVVCSVTSAIANATLQALLEANGLAAAWVQSKPAACGVINGYADPRQLGSDRWAALVAAWQRKRSACVVVSAGTAVTVDALSAHGEFLGGLIVPGLALMKAALAGGTAGVAQLDGELREFPTATGDAVHSGALRAMAGAVNQMQALLARREGVAPALLLSGGDAGILRGALSDAGEIVDNLVLEGLLLIAKETEE